MSSLIKFRQPIKVNGVFRCWHYWGYIGLGGCFIGPAMRGKHGDSQQYTGYKLPTNRKIGAIKIVEIYEGDILTDDFGDKLEVRFGKLPLNKAGDCICTYEAFYCKNYGQLGGSPFYECQEIGAWMERIGNICENPELLK